MKTNNKLKPIDYYDDSVKKIKEELKTFFNTTNFTGKEIAKATDLSVQYISDIKTFLNGKSDRIFSPEKISLILKDLYKAGMIK